MKIHIHTDLEGVSGIDRMEQVGPDGADDRAACEKLMGDLNAAVAGAFDGGATHVTVLDSHAGGGNFILDLLDDRAANDTRPNKKWWGLLDDSYDGAFFIGAHPMAGTINGFLDHTQSSRHWFDYSINGRSMGELAQWAIHAGNFGVPLLMVSGDEAACAEARAFFDPVETAAVKQGLCRNRAQAYPLEEARRRIHDAAERAMGLLGKARPLRPICPMDIRLTWTRADFCDACMARWPDAERLDARTARRVSNNYLDVLF